jgi:lysozyme
MAMRCAMALSVAVLWTPQAARCQIYGGPEAAKGSIVLSNFKSAETSVVIVPEGARPTGPNVGPQPGASETGVGGLATALPPQQLRVLIESVARQKNVAPELLHAVILAESRYDANAVSNRGAIGLMQLLPATGQRFGASDLFSSEQNLLAGAGYLKWLIGQFDGDLELVLAAYNAGEQAVIRAGRKIPPYPETQAYVKKVMASLRRSGLGML